MPDGDERTDVLESGEDGSEGVRTESEDECPDIPEPRKVPPFALSSLYEPFTPSSDFLNEPCTIPLESLSSQNKKKNACELNEAVEDVGVWTDMFSKLAFVELIDDTEVHAFRGSWLYEPSGWDYDGFLVGAWMPCLGLVGNLAEPMNCQGVESHAIATDPLPQIAEQFHKTKMCKFFLKGTCAKGSNCSYAHSEESLKESPNLAKTRLCQNFMNEACFDPECRFAHGNHELCSTSGVYKTVLCRWSSTGKCKDGAACRFAHTSEELRPCNTITSLTHP